ncbi:MAG: hypothetical protein Q9167_004697 [Letrouitia subvulpina]
MTTQIVFSAGCPSQADAAFGPGVHGCRGDFDFTFTFELYFLSIAPSVAFIVAAIPRCIVLWGKKPTVAGYWLRLLKLSAISASAVLQLVLVLLWAESSLPFRNLAISASNVTLVVDLALAVLSTLEHTNSIQPSSTINIYLFFSVLFDAVIVRTLWLTPFSHKARDVFTATFVLKVLLLGLEAAEKRKYYINPDDKQRSPEESSGIYNQAVYWWLNAIIFKGYQKELTPVDLYPISRNIAAETLDSRFWHAWDSSSRHRNKLLFAVVNALKWEMVTPILSRLILIAFTICQPLMVRRFLDYLLDPDEIEDQNVGYGMIGAYFVVYFGMAISGGYYRTVWFRTLTMIRGILTAAVFRKTIHIQITASDDKAAVTLMSTDVDRIVTGLREIHELWANFVQIAIATYLLEIELGYACIAPLVVAALSFAVITYSSSYTKAFQRKWLIRTQKRVTITSSMLGSMKGIKFSGLTQGLESIIETLRLDEIRSSQDFRLLGAYTSTIALFPMMLSPVLAFAIYTASALTGGSTLDVSRLFTSLSTMVLLSQPLFSLFGSIVNSRAAIGCFDRIEQYLLSPSRRDYRQKALVHKQAIDEDQEDHSDDEHTALLGRQANGDSNRAQVHVPAGVRSSNSEILTLNHASFGWTDDESPVLKDIDWTVAPSTLNLLVGRSASGKSTLLKGILGETPIFKGVVRILSAKTAWCEQTPWLINGTIKKNITNFQSFDAELYKTVISCCDLEADIDVLPDREDTNVGSKGITLSGGQKQRIAIARAVYSRPDLAIFDDIFSGLDTVTQKRVFTRLFGSEGLLRRWGTTVIIATHAVNLLPYSDHIIALGSDGRISEQGSFASLKESNGYVQSLNVDDAQAESGSTSTSDQDDKEEISAEKEAKDKTPKSVAMVTNGKGSAPVDLAVYKYYLKSIGWIYALIFVFLQIVGAFFSAFPILWLRWWTEANVEEPNKDWGLYIGVFAGLQANPSFGNISHEYESKLKYLIPLTVQDNHGKILTIGRFSQDIQMVDMNLPIQILTSVQNIFVCIAQAILIASATGWIALSFPPLILVFYALQNYYLATSKQMRILDLSEKAPLYTQFLETLGGLATIRAFGWENYLQTENFELVDRAQRPWYLLFMIQRWLILVLDLVTMFLAVLVVGTAVGLRKSISAGGIGVSLTQIISFTGYIKQLVTTRATLETTLGAIARIKQFSEETENENQPPATVEPPQDWPSEGNIEISNITATYTPSSPRKALDGVSLSIQAGQTIGICGRTGSGKSSLVLALYRMLDLTSGTITIDGFDISLLPRNIVRARLNGLGQDPYFLSGSVRLNLDPYHASTDLAMTSALQSVDLWPTISAKQPSSPLDAELSPDTLSSGQKQLFCLARAILRPGKIVVLDEVTSSVDRKTEERMQEIIAREFQGRTVLSIAHRLETIFGCDKVVVIDGGRCVEFGAPEMLVEKEGSKFRDLWEGREGLVG